MAKKVTSIIMIVSLSLSMIFGGLGLSLHSASAEYDYNGFSIEQLIQYLDDNFANETYYADVRNHLVNNVNIDSNIFYCLGILDDTCFSFSEYYFPNVQGEQWEHYAINGAWALFQGNHYYESQVYLIWNCNAGFGGSGLTYSSYNYQTSFNGFNLVLDEASSFLTYACAFPSSGSLNGDFKLYFSKDVYSNLSYEVAYDANLFADAPEPETIEYELLVFWLGERRYITTKDQSLMRQLWGNGLMEYVLVIESPFDDNGDFDLISYQFNNTILLQYSGVESQLENISPSGVYAIDITSLDWVEIHDSVIYDFVDSNNPLLVGQCTNIPFVLQEVAPEPGTNGTSDSYSNSWNSFITYINNYDTTQVIPDNLVDTIFGVNGFKLYPVDVSLPSSTIPSGNPVTTNIHTYKYHFGSLPNDLGLNYDLMDVCIIPKSFTGNYGLVFFYDDTLPAANKFIDYVDYKDLLDQFDLIIVIDDTLEALQENAWWEIIVPNDVWSHVDYMAVSGSSSLGIQYTSDPLPGNIESGFCIVTKRAIQRQQLYLFNDGITKSYKLMSDFVEKHGLWENSFFEWSQSIFYELQTIGGRTNDIYNLLVGLNLGDVLDNISRQLERIADNTSEEDPGYWFLSLFNFISRFSVSDLDFANWVENYDDFESQIPLPNEDVTPIPIPTITSEVG